MSFRLWPTDSRSLMSGHAWRTWPTFVRGFSRSRGRRRVRSRCSLKLLATGSKRYAVRIRLRDSLFSARLQDISQKFHGQVGLTKDFRKFHKFTEFLPTNSEWPTYRKRAPRKSLDTQYKASREVSNGAHFMALDENVPHISNCEHSEKCTYRPHV